MSSLQQPVIIIGMHRSGTTLVTKVLRDLGLYIGWNIEKNYESFFFNKLNNWIMQQCGVTWSNPLSLQTIFNDSKLLELITDYLHLKMCSPQTISYLGPFGYLRRGCLYKFSIPWGWKDPRNTFTLPIWSHLFSEAKVIHIYRHGVDVAESLRKRRTKAIEKRKLQYKKNRFLYFIFSKKRGFAENIRLQDIDGCFSLWEEYMREAKKQICLKKEFSLEIKYEELLEDPEDSIIELGKFCNLSFNRTAIKKLINSFDSSRAYAYQKTPKLTDFAQTKSRSLALYGYIA